MRGVAGSVFADDQVGDVSGAARPVAWRRAPPKAESGLSVVRNA
jgi:hypothetical protein